MIASYPRFAFNAIDPPVAGKPIGTVDHRGWRRRWRSIAGVEVRAAVVDQPTPEVEDDAEFGA